MPKVFDNRAAGWPNFLPCEIRLGQRLFALRKLLIASFRYLIYRIN
jgi:hypothetical protein